MASRTYSDLVLYRRLLEQAKPYWPHIAGIFALSLLAPPLALLIPLPLKIAVDSIIGAAPLPRFLAVLVPPAANNPTVALAATAGLLVAITLLLYLQGLASWLLQTYTGEKLVLDFRARLFRHVQRLSLSYHDTKGAADSTYRIQNDAAAIQHIVINGLMPLITSCCTVVGMIVVTTQIDWQLALVALAATPALLLLARASRRRLRSRWSEVKQLESSAMSMVQEALSSVRVVKAFRREDHEHERFVRRSSERMRGQIGVAWLQGGFDLLVGLTIAVGTAAALFVGVLHVRSEVLTLGGLLLVMAYLARLYEPLKTLSKKLADIQSSLASAERAFSLLDESPDVAERPNARPLARAIGRVEFRNVSFAYSGDRAVLHEVSFEIGPGARLGIAGTTGAGKTTLVSLLTRFYDPTSGEILLDGVDLRDFKLADLRNQFAIVLQEPVLFSSSIAENIRYARPDATEDAVIQAAQAANAHEFVMRLPQGYETVVGERGMRLSGGERQRISLARAFLKDAPILILDEPTSSVDTRTEAGIVRAMERLMHGRTTIIIAHRPSVLEHCELILKIEHGRLVQPVDSVTAAVAGPIGLEGHDLTTSGVNADD